MQRPAVIILSCFATLAGAASAWRNPAGARPAPSTPVEITVGGLNRSYEIHVPRSPAPGRGYPVLIALHGGGGQAESMIRLTKLHDLADARGFIVVSPNGIDKHWNDGRTTVKRKVDDVGFIAAMLDAVERDYRVDRGRIYATGISNGAIMSNRLACDLSDRIAGIAPVAGTLATDYASACHPANPVAVLQISGDSDPIMPYAGGAVADFGGRGEGGLVQSAPQSSAFWARLDGCGRAAATVEFPTVRPGDSTRIAVLRYRDCPAGARVELWTVKGGGHTWPGGAQYLPAVFIGRASQQVNASAAIADFFLSLPPRSSR